MEPDAIRRRTDRELAVELHQFARAGDVILTGRNTRLSRAIRLATASPASHALLMVTDRYAIEANDHLWNMSERGGGIYVESILHACIQPDIDFIAIRRAPAIDLAAIQHWARWKTLGTATFPSAGLVMQFTRHLGGNLRGRLPRHWNHTERVDNFIEAIADGPHRLMCAELVYRGLLHGGIRIDLTNPMFAAEIGALPPAQPETVPPMPRLPIGLDRELHMLERLSRRRRQTAGSGAAGDSVLDIVSWIRHSITDLITVWRDRRDEAPNGDQADFVTPHDLLTTPTLIDIAHYHRDEHSGEWMMQHA